MNKLLKKIDGERLLLGLAAPVLAVVTALVVTALVLLASGKEPFQAFNVMLDYGSKADSQIYILNKATTYYLAGIAVALGFRMNLFNIGVDGQYRMAAFFAAVVGAQLHLPGVLHILVIVLVAMLVGAMWAGIAGLLKVTRGVSEVISTIMLNAIATSVIAYLLSPGRLAELDASGNVSTKVIPDSGHLFNIATKGGSLYGFIFVAVIVGIAFWWGLSRTRFGFDLRTAGGSDSAALASGVNVKRMVVTAMLLSGAIAGLVGMPELLNNSYQYSLNFPTGIGFTGISVALLGRNNPIGVAIGALLWAFIERATGHLEFAGYDKEIAGVVQGVIVLAVVIAYELVRRYGLRRQQSRVGRQLAAQAVPSKNQEVSA
ncbi:ABC transporter permease [Peterkaempfera griseoplana]|uniref:ABC transporter permease n=1 Tax=Peterkaempfera griseoplana TaxID=66896 RepID=UPI0006E45C15|nr:ABC transporter permease [Peterkaempfera griseoplana]